MGFHTVLARQPTREARQLTDLAQRLEWECAGRTHVTHTHVTRQRKYYLFKYVGRSNNTLVAGPYTEADPFTRGFCLSSREFPRDCTVVNQFPRDCLGITSTNVSAEHGSDH
jgi:hypothetical protein